MPTSIPDDSMRLVSLLDVPVLLVVRGKVLFANQAASALLGQHIKGQDVRLAIRNPQALALVNSRESGTASVRGLSVPGSNWELTSHVLDDDRRLISLEDKSSASGIARAHADFVANASHELRTPLAAILGYVETLSDDKAGGDPATRKRFLGIIAREASRMQALVEDLMSLSRIEATKHDAPRDPVDLLSLARLGVSEAALPERVNLTSNAERAIVAGDSGQLAQVIRNLIDNALKYGRPDGPVNVTIDVAHTGWVMLLVQDEGEGIAPEHLPRLTERFYRADAGRSRQAGGTGLGLSIVKHIVERHRGRFDISSRQGDGTTASMMLPLHRG
jgi:two-component system, OmpR family, phosphate regulon sensor histidine kinase PhoR